MASLFERIRSGWNAFRNNKDYEYYSSQVLDQIDPDTIEEPIAA